MDPFVLVMAVALHAIPPRAEDYDIDAVEKAALVDLESPYMNAQVLAAMAAPYKYGVTQMPCKAQSWQPAREWKPAREPAGRIQWVPGPITRGLWSGIYGTCLIQSPLERDKLG